MVYCTKCGFENEDDATVCAKCGASLQLSRTDRKYGSNDECFGSRESRWGDECFGLHHSGAVVGMIFGILIVIVGIAMLIGESIWQYIGPSLIIGFGLLVIIGTLYRRRRWF